MARRVRQRRFVVLARLCSRVDELTLPSGSISTADGSSLVKMGGTTVVCGVKAELAEPELDTPDQGFLGGSSSSPSSSQPSDPRSPVVPNVDLAAICSPKFKPGPPSEEAQALSERLNAALVRYVFPVPHPTRSPSPVCSAHRSFPCPRSALLRVVLRGVSMSMRYASTLTEIHSMPLSSPSSLLFETVRSATHRFHFSLPLPFIFSYPPPSQPL